MYLFVLMLILGDFNFSKALSQSVKMRIFFELFFRASSRASLIAISSAVNIEALYSMLRLIENFNS